MFFILLLFFYSLILTRESFYSFAFFDLDTGKSFILLLLSFIFVKVFLFFCFLWSLRRKDFILLLSFIFIQESLWKKALIVQIRIVYATNTLHNVCNSFKSVYRRFHIFNYRLIVSDFRFFLEKLHLWRLIMWTYNF